MKYPWQRLSDGNKNWQPYLGTRVAPSDADPSTRPGSRIAKPKPIKVGRVNTAGVFRLHSLRDSVDAGSVSTGASDDEPPKVDADATQEHRFDSFHVLELKADVASNERAEFNAIACSSCGSLLVAAGFLYRKGAIVFRPGTTENGLRGQGLASAQTPLVKDKMEEALVGGVMHVWQTSRDKLWEIWNSTKAGLGLPDLPPVTCLSLADDCLVTGHARAMAHVVNSGAELEMQLQHSGLSSVPSGDVWIWRVDRANQTLELLSRMGCHTCSITSLVVMDPLTSNSWENHMRLTTVTIQGDIKMWAGPAESLELTASLPPHSDKVTCLAYMSKCATQPELLASASNDKTVRIWNLNDSTLMHTLRHTREVYGVAFQDAQGAHLDGILCVTASHDQKTRVWNVTRGICIKALQLHNSPVTCVSFQQNGELMVSGCQGNRVVLADTRSGLRMRTMRGHRGFITAVKIISSSNHLVSSSLDGTVRIWEIISSRNGVVELGVAGPNEPSHGHDKTVYALAFSPDASVLATGSRDFSIKLWDMFTAECKHTLIGHRNFVFSVAIHPTGKLCASASHDGSIGLWDMSAGIQKQVIAPEASLYSSYIGQLHSAEVSDVAFHPSGLMMASGSYDKSVIIYTLPDLERFMDDPKSSPWVPRCSLMHHTGRVWTLTFSPDGKWLATGAWDSTVYIYETSTLQLGDRFVPSCEPKKSQLHCHANVWTAEFQPKPQNDLLILATGAADHKVRIWSSRQGRSVWQVETVLDGHRNTVTSLAWAPDGTMLVSSSFDKTVRLWGQVKDQGKSKFQSYGIWSAYSNATMAVAWALRPMEEPYGASVICVATMNSPTFLMDAGEAGQSYMTCSRAEHTLVQGPSTWDMLLDMVKEFPETLTSLGSGMGLLLHKVVSHCDDHKLLKRFLELAKKNSITPLLPYGPRGKPLLASVNSYHSVSAVVDAIIDMGEMGLDVGAACLASDQAVRLLQNVGMIRSHDIVYKKDWNRRMMLSMDGMVVQPANKREVGETRYPEQLWGPESGNSTFIRKVLNIHQGHSTEDQVMIDVVAVHSSFPHACGMLPHKYVWGPEGDDSKAVELDFCTLKRSFLHLSYNCGEPRLFDTPLGQAVLQFKWEAFGRFFAAAQLMVFVIHLCLVVGQAYALGRLQGAGGWLVPHEYDDWILASRIIGASVILSSTVQASYEMCQILAQGPSNYMTDPWNVLDLCVILLCACSGAAVLAHVPWTPYVVAVASFFAWLKVFYFMRAFTATGGLVRMVMQISYDMRHLLLLLVVGIMAAATSFHALMPGAWSECAEVSSGYVWYNPKYSDTMDDSPWFCVLGSMGGSEDLYPADDPRNAVVGRMTEFYSSNDRRWPGDDLQETYPPNFWDVLLRVYGMVLGDFRLSWFDKVPHPEIGQVLWIIFMFLEMVLLLNLLIALMGDSYEKVQEKSKIEALRERAGLLVEMELVIEYLFGDKFLLKHNYCPRWLHAVLPKEAMTNSDGPGRQREWSGVAGSIKTELEASMIQLRLQMREELERLQDALSRDMQEKMRSLMQTMNDALANAQRDKISRPS